jgi:hypothetical protein
MVTPPSPQNPETASSDGSDTEQLLRFAIAQRELALGDAGPRANAMPPSVALRALREAARLFVDAAQEQREQLEALRAELDRRPARRRWFGGRAQDEVNSHQQKLLKILSAHLKSDVKWVKVLERWTHASALDL